jgi:hypothetical protein
VTQTNPLRLIIDYCLVDRRIILALKTLSEVEVKTIIECGYAENTSDEVLVNEGTVEQKRLLLTTDRKTITRHRYMPCTHGGVILLRHRKLDAAKILASMTAFIQSNKGDLAVNHFTHLRPDSAKIYTHKDPVEVRF